MNATDHVTSLNKWNSNQELRQRTIDAKVVDTTYREVLKTALKRSKSDELKSIELWSKAMLFKN